MNYSPFQIDQCILTDNFKILNIYLLFYEDFVN